MSESDLGSQSIEHTKSVALNGSGAGERNRVHTFVAKDIPYRQKDYTVRTESEREGEGVMEWETETDAEIMW